MRVGGEKEEVMESRERRARWWCLRMGNADHAGDARARVRVGEGSEEARVEDTGMRIVVVGVGMGVGRRTVRVLVVGGKSRGR